MRRQALLLAALPVAAALGIVLLWRGVGSGSSPAPDAETTTRAESPHPQEPLAATPLEAPAGPSSEPQRSAESTHHHDADLPTESFPLDGAVWIEGLVQFPKDAPADDSLEVWVFETSLARGREPMQNDLPGLVRAAEIDQGFWSRRPVDPSGSFRCPVPRNATSVALVVDGRYLYLSGTFVTRIPSENGVISLAPTLGAWLVGRCTVPDDLDPRCKPVRGSVTLTAGRDLSLFGTEVDFDLGRSTAIGADLAFELRGVPAGNKASLEVRPARLVAAHVRDLRLEKGAKQEVEIPLEAGARVSGTVVDDAGAAIGGADVTVLAKEFAFGEVSIAQARSDPDGSFLLFGVVPGSSRVGAEKEGYLASEKLKIEVRDRDERSGITLRLGRGESVSGRVLWPDGSPASRAHVVAIPKPPEPTAADATDPEEHDWWNLRSTETSASENGEFVVSGLGAWPVTIVAKARRAVGTPAPGQANEPGENLPSWTGVVPDVRAGARDVVVELRPPVALAGRVVDDAGAPVRSFLVRAFPAEDPRSPPETWEVQGANERSFESEDGTFEFGGLQPGEWSVQAEAKGYSRAATPAVVSLPRDAAPLVLVLPRSGSASGTVVDPEGRPVPGARVTRSAVMNPATPVDFDEEDRNTPVVTDAVGAFVITNLGVGPARLAAEADGFAKSEGVAVDVLPARRVEGVVLRLRRGGRLTGEVFEASGTRSTHGSVMAVSLQDQENHGAEVDAAGTFAIEDLAPGTYQVLLQPDLESLSLPTAGGAEPDPSEIFSSLKMTSTEIREGETSHVVLGAPPKAPVRLFGTVTRGRQPVRTGMVTCLGEGGALLSRMKVATVRENGEYEARLDEPGTFVLAYQGESNPSPFRITVPPGESFRFDLELSEGALRGVVLGPDARPLEGIDVHLLRPADGSPLVSLGDENVVRTDANGRFAFEGLSVGIYALAAGGIEADFGGSGGSDAPRFGRTILQGLAVKKDQILDGIELRLGRSGRIAGVVRGPGNEPLSNASVFARDERGAILHHFSGVVTGVDGRFEYAGLSAGRYTLCARTRELASVESRPVGLADGGSAEVELVAGPATMLVVTAEDGGGTALPADFSVTDQHGHEMCQLLDVASLEGMFVQGLSFSETKVGPLPPGGYRVVATSFDGRSAHKTVQLSGKDERRVQLRIE